MTDTTPTAPALAAACRIAGRDLVLRHEAVPAGQVVAGAPKTGIHTLANVGEHEVGVWEMTAGAMRDTEDDELFVVIAGAATIEFEDDGSWLLIGPGDVVRLTDGMRTVWTVTQPLRKVYLA
jgi:hypothetical protein